MTGFIVLLRFFDNREQAGALLDEHRAWLQRGFDDGVLLLAGLLQPDFGGGFLAHNTTREALEARVNEDPYVGNNVVSAEIIKMKPVRANGRLAFLLPHQ